MQGQSQDKDRNNTSDWTEVSISEEGIDAFTENEECVNFITKKQKRRKEVPTSSTLNETKYEMCGNTFVDKINLKRHKKNNH